MNDDLPGRVSSVEAAVTVLKERYEDLSDEVASLSRDLADTRTEMRRGFDIIREGLTEVRTSALDSMPKWASEQAASNHKLIGALIALLGIAVTVIGLLAEWKVNH